MANEINWTVVCIHMTRKHDTHDLISCWTKGTSSNIFFHVITRPGLNVIKEFLNASSIGFQFHWLIKQKWVDCISSEFVYFFNSFHLIEFYLDWMYDPSVLVESICFESFYFMRPLNLNKPLASCLIIGNICLSVLFKFSVYLYSFLVKRQTDTFTWHSLAWFQPCQCCFPVLQIEISNLESLDSTV